MSSWQETGNLVYNRGLMISSAIADDTKNQNP